VDDKRNKNHLMVYSQLLQKSSEDTEKRTEMSGELRRPDLKEKVPAFHNSVTCAVPAMQWPFDFHW